MYSHTIVYFYIHTWENLVNVGSSRHKLPRHQTVCNFANFGRTNMIQVGIPPLALLFLIVFYSGYSFKCLFGEDVSRSDLTISSGTPFHNYLWGLTICNTNEFVQSHFSDGQIIVRIVQYEFVIRAAGCTIKVGAAGCTLTVGAAGNTNCTPLSHF